MNKLLLLLIGLMWMSVQAQTENNTVLDTAPEEAAEIAEAAPPLGNGLTQLETFTDGLTSFNADFTQSVYDTQGRLEETSTGVLYLSKPNLLHWKYTEPFPQLIVADGSKVWSHDIDLEQITVREQSAAETQSPLTLLTDTDRLYQSFTLRNLGFADEMSWLEMLPRNDSSEATAISSNDFARILVGLRDGQLLVMALEDSLGQSTEIRFDNGSRNGEVDQSLFVFMPPAGVDVLEG